MTTLRRHCQTCGERYTVRLDTDRRGNLVEFPDPCACVRRERATPRTAPRRQETDAERVRRKAGLCRDCDQPVAGGIRAAYCAEHRRAARLRVERQNRERNGDHAQRKYREQNRTKLAAKARARYQNDPAVRARRNDYKRLYRALNPDQVRRDKERYTLRNYATSGEAAKRWRERVAAGEHQPKPTRRNAAGERLCITPECPSVVRGMAKMSTTCKAGRAEAARAALKAA